MTKRHLTIATRESPLALQQTELIKGLLLAKHPQLSISFLGMTTTGDKRLDVALAQIGGKGLFVKELEEALFDGRADLAVHSMKDVPMVLPPGLCLPVIGEREDPRDAFVSNHYKSLAELPRSAVLGTASLRRQTQLLAIRSDIEMKILRGNIHTRLSKLDQGEFDAIILASAGLKRMQLRNRISSYLSVEQSLPAAGQGALGIECREDDTATRALIAPLDHPITHHCVEAERALCRHLGGGCTVPIAAFAQIHHDVLTLQGLVSNPRGTRILRVKLSGDPTNAESIGIRAAEELLQQGAEKILREFLPN
jgi:hydroxymethylbilane synthase